MRLFDNFCSCKGKQLSDKTTVSLRLLFHFLAAACCVIVGKSKLSATLLHLPIPYMHCTVIRLDPV